MGMAYKEKIQLLKKQIEDTVTQKINLMEVCGTHTMSIAKYAIRSFLPENVNLISGPGCPVCVTDSADIYMAIQLAKETNVIIATFGDMLKIPVNRESLASFKNVSVIYSPIDALEIAKNNLDKEIVLLGIGFETTTPIIASTIEMAKEDNLKNFSVLTMHKTVPVALETIFKSCDNNISGLILPGHVSVITGSRYYDFMKPYPIAGVISGFEALEIMESIALLTAMIGKKDYKVINNYSSLVSDNGNKNAQDIVDKIMIPCDANWRGIGPILNSGMKIREAYKEFDAKERFNLKQKHIDEPKGCLCGQILLGKNSPKDCPHFKRSCTPSSPIGPCMVSSEGTCAAFFKYT